MAHLPNSVRQKILEIAADNEVAVVVPRHGRPSRVFRRDSYVKMQELAREVQPWKHRASALSPPDPLNAKPGRVKSLLSRRDIYESEPAKSTTARRSRDI